MSCVSRLRLCPASGDTENVLLQKILQSLNEGDDGGGGVTSLSVNGGPAQTGAVSISTGGGGVSSVNGDPGPAVLLDSGEVPESGNLYFTTPRVRATDLTGLVIAAGAVSAADTILSALGKFQFRVDALETGASGPYLLKAGDTGTGPFIFSPSASDTTPLTLSNYSVTGAGAAPALSIVGTWDTSGAPTALDINVLNTASGAAALLFNARLSSVSLLNLRTDGRLTLAGRANFSTISAIGHGLRVSDANAASSVAVLTLGHNLSAGVGAAGIGANILWNLDSSTTADTLAAQLATTWADATHAARTSQFVFSTFTGGALTTALELRNGQTLGTPGTVALPTFSNRSDVDTGMFFPAADQVSVSTAGVVRWTTSSTAISSTVQYQHADGSQAAPSISFASDPDTGLFLTLPNTVAFSAGGVQRWQASTTAITGTVQFQGPAGSAATPSFSFSTDTNTGMFQTGVADTLGLSVGGTVRLTLNSTILLSTVIFQGPAGSAGAPAYSFSVDPNTGIYRPFADAVNIATNGVDRLSVGIGFMDSAGVITAPVGTAAAPAFAFSLDSNTGIFQTGVADTLGFSAGGTLRFSVNATDLLLAVTTRLAVAAGANTRAGNAVLVAGTVTVANTSVTANTIVLLTRKTSGGTLGFAITYTVTAATSFTITSDSALDTSTFSYFLIENP